MDTTRITYTPKEKHALVLRYFEYGKSADVFVADKGVGVCGRTFENWVARYVLNGHAALEDKRTTRCFAPLKMKGEVLVAFLALWFLFIRNRRRECGVLKHEGSIKECGVLIAKKVIKGDADNLPGKSSVAALDDGAMALIENFSPDQEIVFNRVLDYYGRFCPGSNFLWQVDCRPFDADFCKKRGFVVIRDATGEIVHPWMQIVIDVFSRDLGAIGVFGGSPNVRQTLLVVRKAMMPARDGRDVFRGSPRYVRFDGGAENKGALTAVMSRLGVECNRPPRACPKLKAHVERLVQTIGQYLQLSETDFVDRPELAHLGCKVILGSVFAKRVEEAAWHYRTTRHSTIDGKPRETWMRGHAEGWDKYYSPAKIASAFYDKPIKAKVFDTIVSVDGEDYSSSACRGHRVVQVRELIGDPGKHLEIWDECGKNLLDVVIQKSSKGPEERRTG